MASETRPTKVPPGHSTDGTSRVSEAQLSVPDGVESSVSSVALDRPMMDGRFVAIAGVPHPSAAEATVPVGELTDAEIMLKVKAGDDAAFEYLVQKYRRSMVSFMYRMAHNATVAEDLAQEVFLRVYRSRGNYQASAKFTTWLYRIATNLGMNHARDTRHERAENTFSLDEPDEESGRTLDLADGTPTAEERILRRERLAAIRQKVEALPERQRLAVVMHKYEQMDYKQIAEVLKLSESATKSLLFRAYETLREQLKEFL
ncbi:MAG TPA: sigma-70 family RNA polymerase sigma factor [Terriglobales bacterium]|nr:sigma-70 family RNA polymerase sigma factor [Terriglobales bacterium]